MKTRTRRTSKPFRRKLHFGSEVWSYRVTRTLVLIKTPDASQTVSVILPTITGLSWDDLERGHWKKWWHGVGPQQIKDYIDQRLRPVWNNPSQLNMKTA